MGGGGGGGRFTGTIGAGGGLSTGTISASSALSGGVLYAAANMGTMTDAGGGRQESTQALPKAPPAIPNNRPLTRFEELAIKDKLADRETLPQYFKVTSGTSLNAGHSKGFETRDLRANDDILVYVKNNNMFFVPLEVKAGSSFTKNETQVKVIPPLSDTVLRFKNHGQLIRYFSIDSQANSFLVEYQVYSRGHYAPR